MNIFKKIEKNINDFFEKSMDYNKTEAITFLIIYLFIDIGVVGIGAIFSTLWLKIGIIYFLISFALCLKLIDAETKFEEYVIIFCLLPHIFLLMFLDKMFIRFIPYRGDNPMLLRSYKVKYLKRKARINKFKFWK